MRNSVWALAGLVLLPAAEAAQIIVQPQDPPGEGFNDNTAFEAEGGNNASTLGEARRNVFRAAAEQWGAIVESNIPIVIAASFAPAPDDQCSSNEGTLGAAGPNGFISDFPGAPQANTFYPVALAKALANDDFDDDQPDIVANFNGAVDTDPDCLSGIRFYYGFDHQGGSGTVDFYNVVMHEIAHGLGFSTLVNGDGRNAATPDFYVADRLIFDNSQNRSWPEMTDTQRAASVVNSGAVVNTGDAAVAGTIPQGLDAGRGTDARARPLIYTPNPFEPSSSIAHWDVSAAPNLLMEPFATGDIRVNRGVDLTSCLMQDIGWPLRSDVACPDSHAADTPPEIGAIPDQTVSRGRSTGPVAFSVTDNSRITPDGSLGLRAVSDNPAVVTGTDIVFSGSGGSRTLSVAPAGEVGNARVTVVVSDGIFTARERFRVTVTEPEIDNVPPIARDDLVATSSQETLTGNVLADNGNGADSDADGEPLTVVAVDGDAEGVGGTRTTNEGSGLRIDADGGFRYTPGGALAELPPGRQRSERFSYRIGDGRGGIDTAELEVIVTGDPGEDRHADTRAGATNLGIVDGEQRIDGAINTPGDIDFYRFSLPRRAEVLLRTEGNTDTVGALQDSGGNVIATGDDSADLNFRIDRTLSAGEYFLAVRGFNNRATGSYQLLASAALASEPADGTNGTNGADGADGADGAGGGGSGGGAAGGLLILLGAAWPFLRRRLVHTWSTQ